MKQSVLRFSNVIFGLLLFVLSIVSANVYAQSRGSVFALTNAKIVTVSGAAIDKGTIIIRDGLIQNVGAGIAIPADAQVIDGTGLTVYPGFFDANSSVGIAAPQRTATARWWRISNPSCPTSIPTDIKLKLSNRTPA